MRVHRDQCQGSLSSDHRPAEKNTHSHNKAHITEKGGKTSTHHPTGGKGRIQHLPAGYDVCQTPDNKTYDANDMHTTTECTGSRPCRGQCIRPGAFPNLARVHTAEGIPQPSTIEVICVPGTPRTRQGYRLNYCGYTKTMSKIPNIEHTDYTKDDSRATASYFIISDYTKDTSKATEKKIT